VHVGEWSILEVSLTETSGIADDEVENRPAKDAAAGVGSKSPSAAPNLLTTPPQERYPQIIAALG